eukprot:7521824-Alexandrium_andersonii.AAC.1
MKALKEDQSLQQQYKALGRGYSQQRQFRAEWAQQQAHILQMKRIQSQTSIEMDEQSGSYEPIGSIV